MSIIPGDPCRLPATEIGRLYAAGTLSPVDMLDALLGRIERINPAINAIVTLDPVAARREAEASAKRWMAGEARSALDGVPVTIKDSIPTAGMRTTWGSRLYESWIPCTDETPVARLRAGGAIILGKTNVPEFTSVGYTDNPVFGPTGNAWNPDLTPGGSSGGAVSAVAAGLGPIALGTDGGGSIRRPAGHCGVVGLKPSTGRVARRHGLPAILYDLEVIGPIARTVGDIRLAYDLIAGPDPADRRSLLCPEPRPRGAPLRILYVPVFGDEPLAPEIRAACDRAAGRLAALGHDVETGAPPFDFEWLASIWPVVSGTGIAMLIEQHPHHRPHLMPIYEKALALGEATKATTLLDILQKLDEFRGHIAEVFAAIDVIILPAAAAQPWPKTQAFPPVIDGKPVGPRGHAVYTGWVNACGHPGITLPAEPASDGMPIGFQLIGGFGEEATLLDLAEAYELAHPWADRWPAIA